MPLVSIVVITYNSSAYVLETLNSAKNQTYPNLELIISDDCSKDDTIKLSESWLNEHQSRFKQVKLISSGVNTGIPGNCNRGWKASEGEWIKIIAGDDILLDNCIEDNINFILENPHSEIVTSDAIKIDQVSKVLPANADFYKSEGQSFRKYFFRQSSKGQLKTYARKPIFLITPTFFIKRDLLVINEGFDERLRIFEDIVFILKVLRLNKKIYYNNKKTVAYRIHNQSVSKGKNKEKELMGLKELHFIYENYRKQSLSNVNIFDLSCKYEAWLQFIYPIKFKLKGARFLAYLSVYRWYQYLIIQL